MKSERYSAVSADESLFHSHPSQRDPSLVWKDVISHESDKGELYAG